MAIPPTWPALLEFEKLEREELNHHMHNQTGNHTCSTAAGAVHELGLITPIVIEQLDRPVKLLSPAAACTVKLQAWSLVFLKIKCMLQYSGAQGCVSTTS